MPDGTLDMAGTAAPTEQMVLRAPPPKSQTFDCPRCGTNVTERFYGPCGACREALERINRGFWLVGPEAPPEDNHDRD